MGRTVLGLVAGMSTEDYLGNRAVQLAAERSLEIIGEAARRISPEFKQAHPEIPWQAWIGQRNVIAHQYDAIRQDLIWAVLRGDLPLVAAVEPLVPALPPDDS